MPRIIRWRRAERTFRSRVESSCRVPHVSPLLRDMGVSAETSAARRPAQMEMPRIGGAIKRGAALCQFLVSCDHYGGVKLLGEIISAFSPQNSSSTEKGVWTRRESNPHLHFDREPCYRCTTGPEPSLWDDAEDSKRVTGNFIARVPNWDESLRGDFLRTVSANCGAVGFFEFF